MKPPTRPAALVAIISLLVGMLDAAILQIVRSGDALGIGNIPLLENGEYAAQASTSGGVFLRFTSAEDFSNRSFKVGRLDGFQEFSATWRGQSSCWMESALSKRVAGVPQETQFLMARTATGIHLLLIPLIDGGFRCSLGGAPDGQLMLTGESGSSAVLTRQLRGLYLIAGDEPGEMMSVAARDIRDQLFPGRGIPPRQLPEFCRYLGWCTWNAFYDKVSEPLMLDAMQRFETGGVSPGFVLVDDGWQPHENKQLTGYDANPGKFPNGIGGLAKELKTRWGVRQLLVWQTCWGYWNGVAPAALPQARASARLAKIPERFQIPGGTAAKDLAPDQAALANFYPGFFREFAVGVPEFLPFYATYHQYLRDHGVDGVKVDAMTWVEVFGENHGGRVAMMGKLVGAMAQATSPIFANNNISCSACSTDFLLLASRNSVTRSSTDFFPDIPASHGEHVFKNALNSYWMGEFVVPDWDMFQSGHPAGAFHAAARAISGGPVYIADEPGKSDFGLLRKLTLSDRSVPPCHSWGRLTNDSFFMDIHTAQRPVKIFNTHPAGAVIGAFHCGYGEKSPTTVRGAIHPGDVPGLRGEKFAVLAHQAEKLSIIGRAQSVPVELPQLGFELFTLAPVIDGIAVIGLSDKFNSGGTVQNIERSPGRVRVHLLDGGRFLAYAGDRPKSLSVDGKVADFTYDPATGALRATLAASQPVLVEIVL